MKRLVYSESVDISGLLRSNTFRHHTTMVGFIYLKQRKFLWWKLKPKLSIKMMVPYLKSPYWDCDYDTNRYLRQQAAVFKAKLEIIKDKIQRKVNRIYATH